MLKKYVHTKYEIIYVFTLNIWRSPIQTVQTRALFCQGSLREGTKISCPKNVVGQRRKKQGTSDENISYRCKFLRTMFH